jgi:hypothetical protein
MSGLDRDDIIRLAREAGWPEWDIVGCEIELERFAALVAAAEREKVAQWMIQRSYATGHGDALEDLLAELDWQITDDWNRALRNGMRTEREACAKVAESKWVDFEELKTAHYRQTPEPFDPFRYHKDLGTIFMSRDLAAAIRARGEQENG